MRLVSVDSETIRPPVTVPNQKNQQVENLRLDRNMMVNPASHTKFQIVPQGAARPLEDDDVPRRLAAAYALDNGTTIIPRATIAGQHAFDRVAATSPLAFQITGTGFLAAGVPIARDSALIDAGLDLRITTHTTVGVSYIGQLAEKAQAHGVKANLLIRF